MKKNIIFALSLALAVTFSPDVWATVYPSEREEVTIPEGYSGAEVLQALFNTQVS